MKFHRCNVRSAWILFLVLFLLLQATTLLAQPDRSAPPQPGVPPQLKLPPIQHFKLSNGMPVVLLEKHTVPIVQINLVVRTGACMDPEGKRGLGSMTAAMLTEGAGSRNALQLADAIDYLGARIDAGAGKHTSGIQLHTPVARLDSALALLADVVRRPTFPQAELDRQRRDRLTTLIQWRDDPKSIAAVLFARTLYGTGHPYGVPSDGNESSLNSLTAEDLKSFHAKYYVPDNTTAIIVGDITPSVAKSRLEKAFGSWKGKAASPPVLPEIQQLKESSLQIVDKPGAPQTVVVIGRVGAPRLTPDFYALVVMNTILGGSYTSRLNQNLREEHGYTYGAGSGFDFRPLPGPFRAGASVQTAVTDKALAEFMKELNGIHDLVSDAELEKAKNYVALSFPGDFQSVGQIAAQLEGLVIYNLPDDYFNNYIKKILAVSREDVQRVAQKYIDVNNLSIVLVGDREQIEDGVKSLSLGTVKELTVFDVLGPAPTINAER
jgi:predicted Zn-dependent peptidase